METQGHERGASQGASQGASRLGSPMPPTVLVVDSDARALRLLEVGLRQAGYRVNAALGGDDAVLQAEAEPPAVAIIDAELADGDGFGLANRLRAMAGCDRVLLLFVVDPRRPSDRLRAFESGAGDVLERPVHLKEALWRVETLLEKAAQRGDLGSGERGQRFFGALSAISILDLLQSMELGRRSGLVHCRSSRGARGVLYFAEGKLIDAEVGRLRGEDALQRILTWNEGEYRVDQLAVLRPDRIPISSSALILEAAKWVDEWNRLTGRLPSLESVLVPAGLAGSVLSTVAPTHNAALSAEVEDVLASFNGQRTIRDVVELDEELPLDTLGRLRGVAQLLTEKLLVPRSVAEPPRRMSLTPPPPAPRLTPSPRLTPPPTPRMTPPLGPVPAPRMTPPVLPAAAARMTPSPLAPVVQPGATGMRLTPALGQPYASTAQGPTTGRGSLSIDVPQIAQVAHSRPHPVQPIAAEHSVPPHAVAAASGRAAGSALPSPQPPSSVSLPELSAEILAGGLSHSDPSGAMSSVRAGMSEDGVGSRTSEDALAVISASAIEPLSMSSIEPLPPSSPEVSGVPSVIVQLQLDAEGKLQKPAAKGTASDSAPRRNTALLQPTPPSLWQRVRTVVIGAGLFGLGVGLYWVWQAISEPTETPAQAPVAAAPAAAIPTPPSVPSSSPPAPSPSPSDPQQAVPGAASSAPAPAAAASPTEAPAAPAASPTPTAAEAAPTVATAPAKEPSAQATPEVAVAPAAPAAAPTAGPSDPAADAAAQARFAAAISKGKQALTRGQFSKTRQAIREASHIKSQSAEVLALQADLALDEGDADSALRLARKALHIDANYADAHLSLAMAAQAQADTGTARSHFKKYLELAPSGERAKDVKAILQGRY